MTDLKLAVFDLDGTLIDSEYTIVRAMSEAWRQNCSGLPLPPDIRRIIGLSLSDACAVLMPWAPHETQRNLAHAYNDAWRSFSFLPEHVDPLFPGVTEALDQLERDGWLLGIATGKSRRGLISVLDANDLRGRFVTLQTADDNPGKPHPAMLLRAARDIGVDIERMVMIGDTSYDMEMAINAKAKPIGVSWGYHTLDDLNRSGALAVLDSFEALAETAQSVL